MDAMASQEDHYLTPPEPQARCESCGTLLDGGCCYYCDGEEFDNDERIDG